MANKTWRLSRAIVSPQMIALVYRRGNTFRTRWHDAGSSGYLTALVYLISQPTYAVGYEQTVTVWPNSPQGRYVQRPAPDVEVTDLAVEEAAPAYSGDLSDPQIAALAYDKTLPGELR